MTAPVFAREEIVESGRVPGANWYFRYQWRILFCVISCFAVALRLSLYQFESGDMRMFLLPWLEHFRSAGITTALADTFSNYNVPYLYLLAFVSLLPATVPALLCIKLIIIPFDLLTAFFVAKIIRLRGHGEGTAMLSYFAVLFLPTAVLNGSVWGQCDIIYTSFLVMALYYLLKNRPGCAAIVFGLAVSFKIQAMFFAPVLLCLWIAGRIRLKHLSLIPLVYAVTLIPALFAGRSLGSLLSIYSEQASFYKNLTLNAPSMYAWISDGDPYRRIPDTYYNIFMPAGYIFSAAVAVFLAVSVANRKGGMNLDRIVQLGFLSVLIMPFILPKMHERYFFPADIFSVLFAFYFSRQLFIAAVLQVVSIEVYVSVLFAKVLIPLPMVTLMVASLVTIVLWSFLRNLWLTRSPVEESEVKLVT